MTEDQTASDSTDVDPQRQAEIEALAAQLASAASGEPPAKAPRKRAPRRVTAKNPTELPPAEEPATAPEGGETAPVEDPAASPATEETLDAAPAETPAAESDEAGTTDGAEDGAEEATAEAAAEGEPRSGRSRRGRSRSRTSGDANGGTPAPASQAAATAPQAGGRRGRGRGPLGDDVEPEILDDDVLIPVAGILDVLDNYAFVRTTGYLPGPTDVYVSLGQVKKYGLRKGDAVVGAIRQPREGEQPGRQKYNALVKVDAVNALTAEQSIARPDFAAGVPVRPSVPLGLTGAVSELGKGARALVIGEWGKTALVAQVAEQVTTTHPETHLMVILVNPRPEEVTDFRRSVKGEVIVAALEQTAEDHVTVIELAIERAKRLVELGIDVVVLIDSITGLGRAHASLAVRGAGEDPQIALPTRRLFASARAIEEGSSLTIIATASQAAAIDRLVTAELRATANAAVTLA